MTPGWAKRLRYHYSDPERPTRLEEDLGGLVMCLALLVLWCALMGAFR
jgi:hypothetical protein